jgi:hypothetical protein
MNFAAEEYDAGASLHVSQPASHQPHFKRMHSIAREAQPSFFIRMNVIN